MVNPVIGRYTMSVLKVRCSDGLLVEVDAEVALKVGTLKDLLFASELPLKNVSSETLEKIVKAVKTPENTLAKVNLLFNVDVSTKPYPKLLHCQ